MGLAVEAGAAKRLIPRTRGDDEVAHILSAEGEGAALLAEALTGRGPHQLAVRCGRDADAAAHGGQEGLAVRLAAERDAAADPGDEAVQVGDAAQLGEEEVAPDVGGEEARPVADPDGGGGVCSQRWLKVQADGLAGHPRLHPDAIDAGLELAHRTQLGRDGVEVDTIDLGAAAVDELDPRRDVHAAATPVKVQRHVVAGVELVAAPGDSGGGSGGQQRDEQHQQQQRPHRSEGPDRPCDHSRPARPSVCRGGRRDHPRRRSGPCSRRAPCLSGPATRPPLLLPGRGAVTLRRWLRRP